MVKLKNKYNSLPYEDKLSLKQAIHRLSGIDKEKSSGVYNMSSAINSEVKYKFLDHNLNTFSQTSKTKINTSCKLGLEVSTYKPYVELSPNSGDKVNYHYSLKSNKGIHNEESYTDKIIKYAQNDLIVYTVNYNTNVDISTTGSLAGEM